MEISWKLYFQLLVQLILFLNFSISVNRFCLHEPCLLRAAALTVQVKQHVCLQQVFGSVHLAFGHVCTQRHPKGNRVLVGIFQLDRKPSERGALTIPAAWSVSCHRRFLVHTPCKAPTGPCRCSRCWRTGSCGTGSPDTPSVPAYWTSSDTKQVWLDGFWVFFSVMV